MGDKGKGKGSGIKKPKAAKVSNRPHEQRAREALTNKVPEPLRSVK